MTPWIERAAPVGTLTLMTPLGCFGVLTKPGSRSLMASLVSASSWGWLRSTMPKTVKASSTAGKTEKNAK